LVHFPFSYNIGLLLLPNTSIPSFQLPAIPTLWIFNLASRIIQLILMETTTITIITAKLYLCLHPFQTPAYSKLCLCLHPFQTIITAKLYLCLHPFQTLTYSELCLRLHPFQTIIIAKLYLCLHPFQFPLFELSSLVHLLLVISSALHSH